MAKTAAERYAEAMDHLDDKFADGRLYGEWVASIEAAVAEERARCIAKVRAYPGVRPYRFVKHIVEAIERGE